MTKVKAAKIEVLGEVASYNYELKKWESNSEDLEELLNLVMLRLGPSVRGCMEYAVGRYRDAKAITWPPKVKLKGVR